MALSFLSIELTPNTLTLSQLFYKDNKHHITQQTTIALETTVMINNLITNPTLIVHHVQRYCIKHHLTNPYALILLEDTAIVESITTLTTNQRLTTALPLLTSLHWDAYRLDESGTHYCYGLPPTTVFQYLLIGIQSSIRLIGITTPCASLIKLHGNKPLELKNSTTTALKQALRHQYEQPHASLCGLYEMGKEIYENTTSY